MANDITVVKKYHALDEIVNKASNKHRIQLNVDVFKNVLKRRRKCREYITYMRHNLLLCNRTYPKGTSIG